MNGFQVGQSDATGSTSIMEVFDPASNQWSVKNPPVLLKSMNIGYGIGGKIYALCGPDDSNSQNYIVEHDPTIDTCMLKSSTHVTRYNYPSLESNGLIFLGGSATNEAQTTFTNKVEFYNPATDTWTQLPDLAVASPSSMVAIGQKIYAIVGQRIEVYDMGK